MHFDTVCVATLDLTEKHMLLCLKPRVPTHKTFVASCDHPKVFWSLFAIAVAYPSTMFVLSIGLSLDLPRLVRDRLQSFERACLNTHRYVYIYIHNIHTYMNIYIYRSSSSHQARSSQVPQ